MTLPKTKHKKNKVYYYENNNTCLVFYYDKEKKLQVFPIETGELKKKRPSVSKKQHTKTEQPLSAPEPDPEPQAPQTTVPFTFPREYPPPMK